MEQTSTIDNNIVKKNETYSKKNNSIEYNIIEL